jgi:peptidoglycan/LPS O-acetylase OafA/YrhL
MGTNSSPKRSVLLDLLRIFAALWVVSYHWSGRGYYSYLDGVFVLKLPTGYAQDFVSIGYLGVDLFFILSGSVIANSSISRNHSSFAKSRFLRLFPVYFLATCLAIVVTRIQSGAAISSERLFSTLGLQFWTKSENVIGAAWTLQYEIQFYFMIYCAMYFINRKNVVFGKDNLRILLNALTIIYVLGPFFESRILEFVTLNSFLCYFLLGACLSQIRCLADLKNYSFLVIVNSVYGVKLLNNRVSENIDSTDSLLLSVFILGTVTIIVLLANSTKASSFLERYSLQITTFSLMTYPIYLLHDEVFMSLNAYILVPRLGQNLGMSTGFVVLLVFSLFIVKIYEPLVRKGFNYFLFPRNS